MPAPARPRDLRRAIRGIVRRHRRPLAAVLSGAGVLLALASLRGAASPDSPTATERATAAVDPARLRAGEVGVPVTLARTASVLAPGDVVDLVTRDDSGEVQVVATGARVIDRPSGGGGLAASTGGLVVVAVPSAAGPSLAVAGAGDALAVVIRSSPSRS